MSSIEKIKESVLTDPDCIIDFNENEITDILQEACSAFQEENALIELDGSIVFIGDIHGDFLTARAIMKRFLSADHLVFLGDYIDREPGRWGSIHTITYLLVLKCCFPRKIVLLKGNHETNYLIPCFPYEFEQEISERFGTRKLHQRFVDAFSAMPLMALSHQVFAAHGGIIKGADLQILRKIGKNDVTAIEEVVWSDPLPSSTYRGAGDRFDKDDLQRFLDAIHANVLLRGHEYSNLGISQYNDRCLTIFSSRRYQEMGNRGILIAQADKEVKKASDLRVMDFSTGRWRKYQIKKT